MFGFGKKKDDDPYNVLGFWPSWSLPSPSELADKEYLARLNERAREQLAKKQPSAK